MSERPQLMHTAIDTTDPRGLAEFYRELLGLRYRPGDEPSKHGPDDVDWIVLLHEDGSRALAIQEVPRLTPTTWPEHDVPMQMHLDLSLSSRDALEETRAKAERLGARLVFDRSDDDDEPLYVLADPAGHPFCILVQ